MGYSVGDELERKLSCEITKEQIAEYSRVSNDPNPMHVDEELAQSAGHPTVFAQGMLSMALLTKYIQEIAGLGSIARVKFKFRHMTWPGEKIYCMGTVTEVKEEGGKTLVTADIRTETEEGMPRVLGDVAFYA